MERKLKVFEAKYAKDLTERMEEFFSRKTDDFNRPIGPIRYIRSSQMRISDNANTIVVLVEYDEKES